MDVSVRASDGLVLQYGTHPGALEGASNYTLDQATEAALVAALAQPNGGVTLTDISGDPASGTVTALAYVAPEPVTPPDPLKPYREALAAAAADDSSLSEATKTALTALLAAMAPQAA